MPNDGCDFNFFIYRGKEQIGEKTVGLSQAIRATPFLHIPCDSFFILKFSVHSFVIGGKDA